MRYVMTAYHLIQMPHHVLIALTVSAHPKRVQIECRLQDVCWGVDCPL
jgi:hypothetical protein